MLPNVQSTRRVRAFTASVGSAASVADEPASAWNTRVTSDPVDSTAVLPSSLSFLDVVNVGLASYPSGITTKPHGSTATVLESSP